MAEARRLVIDTLASSRAALDSSIHPVIDGVSGVFGTSDDCFVFGRNTRASVFEAAYVNGRLANALDFDETFPVGIHFGVGAVVAALLMADKLKLSGSGFLLSVIVGYEIGARLATAIGPMTQIEDGKVIGFPSIWGVAAPVVVTAAAAAAKARRFSPEQFLNALTISASNAPLPVGSQWSAGIDLPNVKYCDAGWCTATGVFATEAALSGSEGFREIFESELGLPRMYGQGPDNMFRMFEGVGHDWHLRDITYKPWPTCRFTHHAMTALETLLQTQTIAPDDIEELEIQSNPLAISERFTQRLPKTFASRQFSYPHMVALQVLRIQPGPRWFDPVWEGDETYCRLRDLVTISLHPNANRFAEHFERNQIRQMWGGVRIKTAGDTYTAESGFALGDPWDPATRYSDDDIARKFLAQFTGDSADALLKHLQKVDELASPIRVIEDAFLATC